MASFRALQPALRQAPRLVSRATTTSFSKRFLNTETAPVLYSAHATVIGARAEGHIEGDNLKIDLNMPKTLGGPGGSPNPEELFAAGYGACFQSAMNLSAQHLGVKFPKDIKQSSIETTVHLVGDLKQADLGLRVDMKVRVKGVSQEDLEKVIEKTKTVCPYSRAIEGNVKTNVEIIAE